MRWVPDHTGRFRWRPYYSRDEIDARCEARIERFLRDRRGAINYPISTDELMVLIEQEADDLDLCADLSRLGSPGAEVEGVTTFTVGQRPRVRISRTLLEDDWREPRLRTTLTHELGHVLLHSDIRQGSAASEPEQLSLFGDPANLPSPVQHCTAASMTGARRVDWMEWQAGYACGALLMPRSAVRATVQNLLDGSAVPGPVPVDHPAAERLVRGLRRQFSVSTAAARVRLLQLGYIAEGHQSPVPARHLFGAL